MGNFTTGVVRLKIRYYTKNSECESERKVDPYVITYRGFAWYLIGYCHLRQRITIFLRPYFRFVGYPGTFYKTRRLFGAEIFQW